MYYTRFGNIEFTGTATSGTSSTLTDSSASFTADDLANKGMVIQITSGTGSGQFRGIDANTSTVITVTPDWTTTPDSTSLYRITRLGFFDEIEDGNGTRTQFIRKQPLINLISLTIDGTSVTPSKVFQYFDAGKLVLGPDAEISAFINSELQTIDIKYIFGIFPLPRIIKRLVIILAAMRTVAAKVSGSYTDFATIAFPGGFSGSKGQPYVNLRAGIDELKREAADITAKAYRPFFIFAGSDIQRDTERIRRIRVI